MAAPLLQQLWVANDDIVLGSRLCSLLAIAAASFCVLYAIIRRLRFNAGDIAQYPPSPRALPIVGHLHLLGNLPHQSLTLLSKRYGPLFSLRLGSLSAVVASSPSMAKLILHTHDKAFSGRPQNFTVLRNISYDSPDIAFSLPNPYWKLMRQLCFTEFFNAKRLDHFKPLRMQEVRNLMLAVSAAEGRPLRIRQELRRASMNLISRMALSKTMEEIVAEIPNSLDAMAAVLELFAMAGEFNVGDYIPWLWWLDLQGYDRKSKRAAHIANSMFQQVIDRRRSERTTDASPRDFLDVLLRAAKDPQHQISDANIRAVILDMFAAGADTSAIATEWALAELMVNPEKLKILQEELDQIVGRSRLVEETDLPNLPYLRAIVNETFRLHPSAPLLVPHMSMEQTQLSSYKIPKDTIVYINAWGIHRDPNIWDNPLKFSPERFLDSNIDALTQQCKFLPFGAGRRICPGAPLGRLNVHNVLANLVHGFDLRALAKPNFGEKFGLVVSLEEPLVIVPLTKLPKAIFEAPT